MTLLERLIDKHVHHRHFIDYSRAEERELDFKRGLEVFVNEYIDWLSMEALKGKEREVEIARWMLEEFRQYLHR